MHQHHIGLATPPRIKSGATALRPNHHGDSSLLFEDWQKVLEQTGVPYRCSRCHNDESVLRVNRRRNEDKVQYNGGDQGIKHACILDTASLIISPTTTTSRQSSI